MMKTPQFRPVILLASFLVFQAPFVVRAQTRSGDSIFAPFVSQLRGEVKNNLVRLNWLDSRDVRGPVFIYRSQTPFDNAHPYYLIRPIEAPYGAQSYIDEVEKTGEWHYFIAASDEWGQRYEIFMPYGNTVTVMVGEIQDESPRSVRGPGTASGIIGLEAAVRGDGVLVSFRSTAPVMNPVLYRSVNPITKTRDLLNAVLVEDGISSPFMDYPVPGIPYYYAVIAEDALVSGNVEIHPGYNATVIPVEVSTGSRIGLGDSPGIRSIPLPLISMNAVSPGSGYGDVPSPTPLSPEAARAVNSLGLQRVTPRFLQKTPKVFDQDLEPPSGGEEYPLRSIVQGSFKNRDWPVCKDELTQYLSLPRSAASENRARFYLAQVYYFTGSYREALFEFLTVQSDYPQEAADWIQTVLTMLTR
ncbi:MAG: hypothetical protein LBH57_02675 [Treponema sp.]|jgi:hypothetical protein|nr:hypothetical protein [Treponema sp.]